MTTKTELPNPKSQAKEALAAAMRRGLSNTRDEYESRKKLDKRVVKKEGK